MDRVRGSRAGSQGQVRGGSRRPAVAPGRRIPAAQLRRLIAGSSSPTGAEIAQVRMLAGNGAAVRLLAPPAVQPKLYVGPADDAYEREADRVATAVMRVPASRGGTGDAVRRPIGAARGALPDATRAEMEQRFGVDFGHVRVHTGSDAVQLNRSIGAEAVTYGADIWFDAGRYRPNTNAGQELLAHELTHVVQQTGVAGRAAAGDGDVAVQGRAPTGLVSAKRRKVYLDFVRMKRLDPQFDRIIAKQLGLGKAVDKKTEQSGGTYGHWWTELGDLTGKYPGQWKAARSYGWWPAQNLGGVGNTLAGVPGQLNAGNANDPHHGEDVKSSQMFHPVMSLDTATADYAKVRADITTKIKSFAEGYRGTWRWTFGWGKNCHTFQQALKTAVGLHYQKGEAWFTRPDTVGGLAEAAEAERQKEAQDAWNKAHPGQDFTLRLALPVASDFSGDIEERLPVGSTVRLLDDQLGGDIASLRGWSKCEIAYEQRHYFTYYADLRKAAGLPAV